MTASLWSELTQPAFDSRLQIRSLATTHWRVKL
jgi:hypothetical protein